MAGKAVWLSCLSHPIHIGLRSWLHGGQSSKRMLFPCIICSVVLAVWGVAFSCIRTIPRFALICGIVTGWRIKFLYLAAFRFWWIGTIGVFVFYDISAHIITEPPPNCPLALLHMRHYNVPPFFDRYGSVHRIAANSPWTHQNLTSVCTCIP